MEFLKVISRLHENLILFFRKLWLEKGGQALGVNDYFVYKIPMLRFNLIP